MEANVNAEQEAAAFLRERFLKLIGSKLAGRQCAVEMFENTTVECRIKSIDPKFGNILVEDLKTPMPPLIKYAILRTNDIINVNIPNV